MHGRVADIDKLIQPNELACIPPKLAYVPAMPAQGVPPGWHNINYANIELPITHLKELYGINSGSNAHAATSRNWRICALNFNIKPVHVGAINCL